MSSCYISQNNNLESPKTFETSKDSGVAKKLGPLHNTLFLEKLNITFLES